MRRGELAALVQQVAQPGIDDRGLDEVVRAAAAHERLRRAQLDHLISVYDELYPSLRLYLFDAHRVYSSPVTVFGPHLAVIYLGRHYIAFRDPARVASISQHFDWLVREAPLGAREVMGHLRDLRAGLD